MMYKKHTHTKCCTRARAHGNKEVWFTAMFLLYVHTSVVVRIALNTYCKYCIQILAVIILYYYYYSLLHKTNNDIHNDKDQIFQTPTIQGETLCLSPPPSSLSGRELTFVVMWSLSELHPTKGGYLCAAAFLPLSESAEFLCFIFYLIIIFPSVSEVETLYSLQHVHQSKKLVCFVQVRLKSAKLFSQVTVSRVFQSVARRQPLPFFLTATVTSHAFSLIPGQASLLQLSFMPPIWKKKMLTSTLILELDIQHLSLLGLL